MLGVLKNDLTLALVHGTNRVPFRVFQIQIPEHQITPLKKHVSLLNLESLTLNL